MADETIKIDPEPTSEKEAAEFQSKDDALLVQKQKHELALLEARKGYIDDWLGALNPSRNAALVVCAPLLILVLVFGLAAAMHTKPEVFTSILDNLFKLLVLVVGFFAGAAASKGQD